MEDNKKHSTYLSGQRAEQRAAEFLRGRGYQILLCNYRTRRGEIDLVAREDGCLVFVEVKARSSAAFGTAEEALTPRKRRRLLRAAQHFLSSHPWDQDVRFDVVTLNRGRWRLYRNALEA